MAASFPKKISKVTRIPFTTSSYGLYAISITASCENKSEYLRVEIDTVKFREIPVKDNPQYFTVPPAWNGNQLKGLQKTVIFLLKLNKGKHMLKFILVHNAIIEKYTVEHIKNTQQISFNINQRALKGDRRPWYTFVLYDLPLKSLSAEASVSWRFRDGDDIKTIINSSIKINNDSKLHKYWVWSSNPLKSLLGHEREKKEFTTNLSDGTHYIEFWADNSPTLYNVDLNLGNITTKRIPTSDDPEWTGDFTDDSDQILLARLILGEMENETRRAKIGAGYTVLNRLKKHRSNWGYSIKEIILKESQYDALWNRNTSDKVRDPLKFGSRGSWKESFEIAGLVLTNKVTDPTKGATHFYSTSTATYFPPWATDDVFKIKIGITYFYELER